MSISVIGKLHVKEVSYKMKPGTFNVGELVTDLAKFSIRNDVLDQFTPGKTYEGSFILSKIFNQTSTSGGQVFVNMRAELDWEALAIMAESNSEEDSGSLTVSAAIAEHTEEPENKPVTPKIDQAEYKVQNEDLIFTEEALKQALEENMAIIKLDATCPNFRSLIPMIKATKKYDFCSKDQSWRLQ